MITLNNKDIYKIFYAGTLLSKIYLGINEIWSNNHAVLKYSALVDTSETIPWWYNYKEHCYDYESNQYIGSAYYYDDSYARYIDNINYYIIGSSVERLNGLEDIENKGLLYSDLKSITIPSSYKNKPVHGIGIKAFAKTKLKYLDFPDGFFLDKEALGDVQSFVEATPTADEINKIVEHFSNEETKYTTFTGKLYFEYKSLPITDTTIYKLSYIKPTTYNINTVYYTSKSTIWNLPITMWNDGTFDYYYAQIGSNPYAICLGLTQESYYKVYGNYRQLNFHANCKYIYDKAFMTPSYDDWAPEFLSNWFKYTNFNSGLIEIGSRAFYSCAIESNTTDDSEIIFPNSLKYIQEYAFTYGTQYRPITFPNSVQLIGRSAFQGCTNSNIFLNIGSNECPAIIKSRAFMGNTNLFTVDLTSAVLSEIESAVFTGCTSLRFTDAPSTYFSMSNGAVYNESKDNYLGTCLIYSKYAHSLPYPGTFGTFVEIKIKDGTEHIAGKAFVTDIHSDSEITRDAGWTGEKLSGNIWLPISLKSVGQFAFGAYSNLYNTINGLYYAIYDDRIDPDNSAFENMGPATSTTYKNYKYFFRSGKFYSSNTNYNTLQLVTPTSEYVGSEYVTPKPKSPQLSILSTGAFMGLGKRFPRTIYEYGIDIGTTTPKYIDMSGFYLDKWPILYNRYSLRSYRDAMNILKLNDKLKIQVTSSTHQQSIKQTGVWKYFDVSINNGNNSVFLFPTNVNIVKSLAFAETETFFDDSNVGSQLNEEYIIEMNNIELEG